MDKCIEEDEDFAVIDDLGKHVHEKTARSEYPQEVKYPEPHSERRNRHQNHFVVTIIAITNLYINSFMLRIYHVKYHTDND